MPADYLLKIAGIDGSSRRDGFKNQIELKSFSWGGSNQSSFGDGVGGGVARVDIRNLTVTKTADKASPLLFYHCATGKEIKEILLSCREGATGKQEAYLKIKLSPAIVTSFETSGSGEKPDEVVTFAFERIDFTYNDQG